MATLEQLHKALVNADAAASKGDAQAAIDAKQIANEISSMQAQPKSEFSASETLKNVPASAMQYGQNIAAAVMHPVQTGKNILDVGSGLMVKHIPGYEKLLTSTGSDTPEELARVKGVATGLEDYYAQRYGSKDSILKAIQEDPVGVAGDLSAILTGGGAAIPKAGQAISKVGAAVEPLNLATKSVGYAASKAIPETVPAKLYESATKWSTSLPIEERAALTETALKEQLSPSYAGVGQAQLMTRELGNTIDMLVENATQTGAKIPSQAIFSYINDARSKLGGPKIEAAQDLAEINKIERQFKSYLGKNQYKELTPRQLQDFKTNTYKKVDYDKSNQRATMAREEVYKGMARAAKESLEKQIPEIKDLNKRQGALIDLLPNLERAASRIENRDLLGIGGGVKTGGGYAIGGDIGAAIGAGQSILDMPKIKSKLALDLYKKQQQGAGMFYDNSTKAALMRQLLEEQGAYGQNVPGLLY